MASRRRPWRLSFSRSFESTTSLQACRSWSRKASIYPQREEGAFLRYSSSYLRVRLKTRFSSRYRRKVTRGSLLVGSGAFQYRLSSGFLPRSSRSCFQYYAVAPALAS